MDMDARYRRRIRIMSGYNRETGHSVVISDVETGEMIGNVASVQIILDPAELNIAELTYHKTNGDGKFLRGEDGGPITRKQRLHDLEIDLTALEVPTITGEKIARVKDALLAWAGCHRGKGIAEECMPRFHELIDRLEALEKEVER